LNAFKAKNDAAIDTQLQRMRDDASVAATIDMVVRQVQEKYVRESPSFPLDPATREVNAKILWEPIAPIAPAPITWSSYVAENHARRNGIQQKRAAQPDQTRNMK
jgi:hypothetical protein